MNNVILHFVLLHVMFAKGCVKMKKFLLITSFMSLVFTSLSCPVLADDEFENLSLRDRKHYFGVSYDVPTHGIQATGRYLVSRSGMKYATPVSELKRKKHAARIIAQNHRYLYGY